MSETTPEALTPKRVGLFGGTGFVGSYLVDALLANDYEPVLLVRNGSEHKIRQQGRCTIVSGDIDNRDAIERVIEASDALIYNIGILREFPRRDITFARLQDEAARRVIEMATAGGVQRFVLMSANGAKPDGTDYQRSKFQAEACLQDSTLDWTIFRPSVLFGDPRGLMEFATQLSAEIIDSPLPAPLFHAGLSPFNAGAFTLSPVHVTDVAAAFIKALQDPQTIGRRFHLGGADTMSWRDILTRLAEVRRRRKLMLPAPASGVIAVASLLDRFEKFPITGDQVRMLLEGNACPPDDLVALGIDPQHFSSETLRYLSDAPQDADTA